jgi:hypothetical protein
MKICLRRAAHISAERLISAQTDEQTEIDMETHMDVDIGVKSVYIRAFWPREISQSTSLRIIQSNTRCYDMEIGQNCVRVFYGTEKREKEKYSRYIQEASAPAAVTMYQICNISPAQVHL